MKAKYNHERFDGNLVKALHTWAEEDQGCNLRSLMEGFKDDPDNISDILDYWAYDQLVEFVKWLFKEASDADNA